MNGEIANGNGGGKKGMVDREWLIENGIEFPHAAALFPALISSFNLVPGFRLRLPNPGVSLRPNYISVIQVKTRYSESLNPEK